MYLRYLLLLLSMLLISCSVNNSLDSKDLGDRKSEESSTINTEADDKFNYNAEVPFKDGQIIMRDGKKIIIRVVQVTNVEKETVSLLDLEGEGISIDKRNSPNVDKDDGKDDKNNEGIKINKRPAKPWSVSGTTNSTKYIRYVSSTDVYEFTYFRPYYRGWTAYMLTARKRYRRNLIRAFCPYPIWHRNYVYYDNTYLYSRTTYYFHRDNGGWTFHKFDPYKMANTSKEQTTYDKDGIAIKYYRWSKTGTFEQYYSMKNVSSITIQNQSAKPSYYKVGETLKLSAKVVFSPSAAEKYINNMKIEWSSSDDSIASVDQNGNVTFNRGGNADIKAKTVYNNKESTYSVSVFGINTISSLTKADINETISFTGTKAINNVNTSSYLWQYKKGNGNFVSFDNGNSRNINTLNSIKNFTSSGNYQVRLKYNLNGKNYYTKPMDITVWANYTNVINWSITTNFYKNISDLGGNKYGSYSFGNLDVNYHVYKDLINNKWRIKISSIKGHSIMGVLKDSSEYNDVAKRLPNREESAYYAIRSLKAQYKNITAEIFTPYGHYNSYKGTIAHEMYHHREYTTAIHHYLKAIESKVEAMSFNLSLFNSKNDLINSVLKNRGQYVSILNLLYRGSYRTPKAYLFLKTINYCHKLNDGLGTDSKPEGARQNLLNKYIILIQEKARKNGWNVDMSPPIDIDVSNPCYLPF